jgi:hypothetical protein
MSLSAYGVHRPVLVWPICFNARHLDEGRLVANSERGGTVPMWKRIGEDGAVTFSD